MDISQLVIVAVAVAGAVIVGLLAIVPTVLELPRRRDLTDSADDPIREPAPRGPVPASGSTTSHQSSERRASAEHKLAA